MKSLLKLVIAAAAILAGTVSFAQNRSISGKVTDEKGETLPGATLIVSGTNAYAVTDLDGKTLFKYARDRKSLFLTSATTTTCSPYRELRFTMSP